MYELIENMSKNMGSLSLFLNNPKNINILCFLNNSIPTEINLRKISEKVYYLINKVNTLLLCDCGSHRAFIGFKSGYRLTCGKKYCSTNKRKKTCVEKWGVDNPKKSKTLQKIEGENIRKKWGGKHYMSNVYVKDKFKNTMKERYGVEWAQQSTTIKEKSIKTWKNNPEKDLILFMKFEKVKNKTDEEKLDVLEKRRATILEKWGIHYMNNNDIKDKIKNTYLNKYGVDSPFKDKSVSENRIISYRNRTATIIKSLLNSNYSYTNHGYNKNKTGITIELYHKVCNESFIINQGLFKSRLVNNEVCLICNPILSGRSKREVEVFSFIKDNYSGNIITNHKNLISNELDIYLPDLNLAFEFNGLYWHSDIYKEKSYHINKTNECIKNDTSLLHIWEDDWDYKNNIVKSIILNKIGKSPNKIGARKCIVREVIDNNISRKFLEENHIQGFIGAKVKIGLFYDDELISIMTFGSIRRSLGYINRNGYEMLRFCNKLNTNVVGGASRLFKYFLKNYNPIEIISYSDTSRSNGNMYNILGFKFSHQTAPNYYWIVDGVRKHRFNYRKDKLIENGFSIKKTEIQIMKESGYNRIFDCGSKKWIYLHT